MQTERFRSDRSLGKALMGEALAAETLDASPADTQLLAANSHTLAAGVTAAVLGAAALGALGSPLLHPAVALAPIAWWLCNAALKRSARAQCTAERRLLPERG